MRTFIFRGAVAVRGLFRCSPVPAVAVARRGRQVLVIATEAFCSFLPRKCSAVFPPLFVWVTRSPLLSARPTTDAGEGWSDALERRSARSLARSDT